MKLKKFYALALVSMLFCASNYRVFAQDHGNDIIWHVKAYQPEAKLLKVKAFSEKGDMYDVKAIQNSDQTDVLDVKALVNGTWLPVKMLVKKDEKYYPIKVITADGTILKIKAITEDGTILDVKGVKQIGNLIDVCAINEGDMHYNILAFSPDGHTNVLKGLKMTKDDVEVKLNGIEVFAHIKAIPQSKN